MIGKILRHISPINVILDSAECTENYHVSVTFTSLYVMINEGLQNNVMK